MYSLLRKQCGLAAVRLGSQARTLATVQTTSTPRQNQLIRPQGTPVSRERATLTIKDGPIFHGKSFGAKATVSGEAVFTTSLVGYPESVRTSYAMLLCPDLHR
jgi:carbamoyl-phosphate synthase small subunit